MVCRPEGTPMANNPITTLEKRTKQNQRQVIQTDVLPDDVLLGIFDFYVDVEPVEPNQPMYLAASVWQTLVHVCRRWRSLVFQSPRRLNLQLYCTPETPVKDKSDIWPTLPLIVGGEILSSRGTDNVIAVLEQSNRVRKVDLWNILGGQFETLLAAMQVPFPELTHIHLSSYDETIPPIPDSFLDGSAPSLQDFWLYGIPFLGLPKLLLSADHLATLSLSDIPHSGYFSPKEIVNLLSGLSSLVSLWLRFRSPQSRPGWRGRSLPTQKRFTLPLRRLFFTGVIEYLEELVAGIDTPRLDEMQITFFNQIDFDCPRLAQFFNCTPTLRALDEARIRLGKRTAVVVFQSRTSSQSGVNHLEIGISCREPDWQLSFFEQILNSCLPTASTIKDLYIGRPSRRQVLKNDAIENTLWLQLLLPFTAVKNLYLANEVAPGITAALQELVGGRNTEALLSLENIFVEELEAQRPLSVEKDVGQFVAARQLSDHPITVSVWDTVAYYDADRLLQPTH